MADVLFERIFWVFSTSARFLARAGQTLLKRIALKRIALK
jgi:hypothetical protein